MGTLSPIIVQTAPEGSYRLLLASWRASSLVLTTVRWGETNGEKQRISEKNGEKKIAFYGG